MRGVYGNSRMGGQKAHKTSQHEWKCFPTHIIGLFFCVCDNTFCKWSQISVLAETWGMTKPGRDSVTSQGWESLLWLDSSNSAMSQAFEWAFCICVVIGGRHGGCVVSTLASLQKGCRFKCPCPSPRVWVGFYQVQVSPIVPCTNMHNSLVQTVASFSPLADNTCGGGFTSTVLCPPPLLLKPYK